MLSSHMQRAAGWSRTAARVQNFQARMSAGEHWALALQGGYRYARVLGGGRESEVIDLQCWQLTVADQNLRAVGKQIVQHPDRDYLDVFGPVYLQCAEITKSSKMRAIKIVGTPGVDYELEEWKSAAKEPTPRPIGVLSQRRYGVDMLSENEGWVLDIFHPVRKHPRLRKIEFHAQLRRKCYIMHHFSQH